MTVKCILSKGFPARARKTAGANSFINVAAIAILCAISFATAARYSARQSVLAAEGHLAKITIDYPEDGSLFPPDIVAPTFIWRDESQEAVAWKIDILFRDGSKKIEARSSGERLAVGEIDERCISSTNELPKATPEQVSSHVWTPDAGTWEKLKQHSLADVATVTFTGFTAKDSKHPVSQGSITIQTSKDPVGAPIFYRDVPLMPSETEKGIIKPLATGAIPLIQWRLRDVSKARSRVVLEGMHTCANCHSFSLDGKTMGMDMDGPANDKGLYALVSIKPQMSIGTEDMVNWNPTQDRQFALNRVGFMSQVSPDGRYVMTTVTSSKRAPENNFYVVNFKDYHFLQVFYPTRSVLAWYDRTTGERHPLPGADDPSLVQTDGVWSPDGKYIVFARAEAEEPYPANGKMAEFANDPNEVQIQYDLYRIPFNEGRGGSPEPIAGASANGMSNNFPKVSPDGKWIVFVKCHNGQLMRPDSELYIVPAEGGEARRLRANKLPMNSWHSFSPNGRWLVFSSKRRSPYTQMYLTHIDEQGNDTPAILVENSTAANRAVNIPEFVNIPPDGLVKISTPAVDMYRRFDEAVALGQKGEYAASVAGWEELAKDDPDDARVQNNLGLALARTGKFEEAIPHYEKGLELNPQYHSIHGDLGRALMLAGRPDEAIPELEEALEFAPDSADIHNSLGRALTMRGQLAEATAQFQKAVELDPQLADAEENLGVALLSSGQLDQAEPHFEKALKMNPSLADAHCYMGMLLYSSQRIQEALVEWREALRLDPKSAEALSQTARALSASPDATLRDGAEAVKLAEQAVQLSGSRVPAYLDSLAMAYAETGRFPEAIATARQAQTLATEQNNTQLAEDLGARLKLYEAQQPYRDVWDEH
jgi:tetratricopeptide (TPR) repeat protein